MKSAWVYIRNNQVIALSDFEMSGIEYDRVAYVESEEEFMSAELNDTGKVVLLTAEVIESRMENN